MGKTDLSENKCYQSPATALYMAMCQRKPLESHWPWSEANTLFSSNMMEYENTYIVSL